MKTCKFFALGMWIVLFLGATPILTQTGPAPAPALQAEDGARMERTWYWTCCKDAKYKGRMTLKKFNDPKHPEYNFSGTMDGAGGNDSINGLLKGDEVEFTRASTACTSNGDFQTWKGTISFTEALGWVVNGTSIGGCNVDRDLNIKENPRFIMSVKKPDNW